MNRREFVKMGVSGAVATWGAPWTWGDETKHAGDPSFDDAFLQILDGFVRNAEATAKGFAVCDFPEGTKLASCCTPSGKTYTSVARMLPAMAEWVAAGCGPAELPGGRKVDVRDVLAQVYAHAFDPKFEHFWGEPIKTKPTQRSVEAALVAMSLARLGPDFVGHALTSEQRRNVNDWLASCSVLPERKNNHAWFHATNQAARLRLGEKFEEFKGDAASMLEDVKAMDALADATSADGWYSDSPDLPLYDLYNFWTFANFPLYWGRIIGDRYPEWNDKFQRRAKLFLKNVPYFFAADGAIPLLGRSLCYRWSTLAPMLVGYRLGLWPHSPALLRTIAERHLRWWWRNGAYDAKLGKLRETLTPEGTTASRDPYIDNGSPYWTMLGFETFSLPKDDPFWTDPPEPLPVERDDFAVRLEGPRMMLVGNKASGQVRWVEARNQPKKETYRDQYDKFVYSSAFPFNMDRTKGRAVWDQAIVFRDAKSGECAARSAVDDGELTEDGVKLRWRTKLGDVEFAVVSTIKIEGEFERRTHEVSASGELPGGTVEVLEGSYPLGLGEGEKYEEGVGKEAWTSVRGERSGKLVFARAVKGFNGSSVDEAFGEGGERRVNLMYPRMAVITLRGVMNERATTLVSVFYASAKPMNVEMVAQGAKEMGK